MFEAKTPTELQKQFEIQIDDFFLACEERDARPNRSFTGNFRLRTDRQTHRDLSALAEVEGKSMNDVVNEAIHNHLKRLG